LDSFNLFWALPLKAVCPSNLILTWVFASPKDIRSLLENGNCISNSPLISIANNRLHFEIGIRLVGRGWDFRKLISKCYQARQLSGWLFLLFSEMDRKNSPFVSLNSGYFWQIMKQEVFDVLDSSSIVTFCQFAGWLGRWIIL